MAEDNNNKMNNTNRGYLYLNRRKNQDKHPDLTGKMDVDGVEKQVSAWERKDKDGNTYWALTISEPYKGPTNNNGNNNSNTNNNTNVNSNNNNNGGNNNYNNSNNNNANNSNNGGNNNLAPNRMPTPDPDAELSVSPEDFNFQEQQEHKPQNDYLPDNVFDEPSHSNNNHDNNNHGGNNNSNYHSSDSHPDNSLDMDELQALLGKD
jgi:hypothetical protein